MIIVAEITFWVCIIIGLVLRYAFQRERLSKLFLFCTPLIDVLLLVFVTIDLARGASASFIHGLAAYYIGMTVAFGHNMIQWADNRAVRFIDRTKSTAPRLFGAAHAKAERIGWYRHCLGWAIGNAILLIIILIIGNEARTKELYQVMQLWLLVLTLDFLHSFSYTLFPKKENKKLPL